MSQTFPRRYGFYGFEILQGANVSVEGAPFTRTIAKRCLIWFQIERLSLVLTLPALLFAAVSCATNRNNLPVSPNGSNYVHNAQEAADLVLGMGQAAHGHLRGSTGVIREESPVDVELLG